jgi:3-oxoacyl-[acyl-carrier protein] reductase
MTAHLQSRAVIVTGAAHGIGLAISSRIIREGLNLIACDIDQEGLNELKGHLRLENCRDGQVSTFKVDVCNLKDVTSLFDQLKEKKQCPYGLVNNAGIFLGKKFLDYKPEDIERILAVNLVGPIHLTQQFGRMVLEHGSTGVIVNMASIAGQIGSSDAIYGITKSGMIGLTKTSAMSFAPNIRVNAVAPGIVSTELQKSVPQERLDQFRKGELLKSPIMPEDVADTVWFLLSDLSKHYTGAVLDINNGFAMR